jgi:hypothetical protein
MLVMRNDNHYVDDFMLDSLIKSKQIVKFKRNTEWVNIGSDPIMGNKQEEYLTARIAID